MSETCEPYQAGNQMNVEIIISWDIEGGGVPLDLLRSRIRGKAGYMNVVIRHETAILVRSDKELSQVEAKEAITAILKPNKED